MRELSVASSLHRPRNNNGRHLHCYTTALLLVLVLGLLSPLPLPCNAWSNQRASPQLLLAPRMTRKSARLSPLAQSLATPPAESSAAAAAASSSSSSSGSPFAAPESESRMEATAPPPLQHAVVAPTDASTSSSSSASSSSIQHELQSGRVLEGGQVIDFSSVKASERAEYALAQARQQLLARQHAAAAETNGATHVNGGANGSGGSKSTSAIAPSTPTAILGINQDVIELVGHELGTFATASEIQDCAAYLRSQAPAGLLQPHTNDHAPSSNSYTPQQISRFRTILSQAYLEAGEVTGAFAKTFYMGTMLLPPAARQAIWAVYVWCRRTDEIVDAPRSDTDDDMLLDLSAWELRLENLWQYGDVVDVYDLCLLDCRIKYPTMDITPFMDMIRGMLMDVPDLGQDRYDKFDELHLYCYRVAGTVGLMSLPIFGCAPGFDDETAR